AMTSVWQNATETEVYAPSLLLAVAAIAAADLAGRGEERAKVRRWLVVAAYCLALAVPLHASALVAAPVVVFLATARADGRRDWSAGLTLAGVAVASMGITRSSVAFVLAGVAMLVAAAVISKRAASPVSRGTIVLAAGVACVAVSALAFLLLRARHDPTINQGNPTTWSQVADVTARHQYDLPGLWPRRAAVWIQLANWFEYADWQFGLSLGPTVIPTISRFAATLLFASLGVVGSLWQREYDRRTWRAVALLFVCGSLGVIVYLNLKAGASFGWPFVEASDRHEARERDYFFVLGFWAWGIWAGLGALWLVARFRAPLALGVALAALPIALNWSAMNRRAEPEASLPRMVAESLLGELPPRAVLFVAGDNDSYPLWYAQQARGLRRDVTIVTMPLLEAPWYIDELRRRFELTIRAGSFGPVAKSRDLAASASRMGRPVAVALTVPDTERSRLANHWNVIGLSALAAGPADEVGMVRADAEQHIAIDSTKVLKAAAAVAAWARGRDARPAIDPVHEYFLRVLSCPAHTLTRTLTPQVASLDSTCNLR
ncbi:MAG TPA: DUF2723 domain-containing protein, partial [Gemmatimonadaceae bacterium]